MSVNSNREKVIKHIEFMQAQQNPLYDKSLLLNHLFDDDILHLVDISNRRSGKSYGYFSKMIDIAYRFDLKFMAIVRHDDLKKSIIELIDEIFGDIDHLDQSKLVPFKTPNYVKIQYKGKDICLITDLNSCSDFKFDSQVAKHFPILVYDEFLALEGDYNPNEYEQLKTIYKTVDRADNKFGIKPKIIYLGNAVNFSSPILPALKLFGALASHELNTIQKYNESILLYLHKNEEVNKLVTKQLFPIDDPENDPMMTAKFDFNAFLVAPYNKQDAIISTCEEFAIKLTEGYYCVVYYNQHAQLYMLDITTQPQNYLYNVEIQDTTEQSYYLFEDSYYSATMQKRYLAGWACFTNPFSKEYFLTNYSTLRINKLIGIHISERRKFVPRTEEERQIYNDNLLKRKLNALLEEVNTK